MKKGGKKKNNKKKTNPTPKKPPLLRVNWKGPLQKGIGLFLEAILYFVLCATCPPPTSEHEDLETGGKEVLSFWTPPALAFLFPWLPETVGPVSAFLTEGSVSMWEEHNQGDHGEKRQTEDRASNNSLPAHLYKGDWCPARFLLLDHPGFPNFSPGHILCLFICSQAQGGSEKGGKEITLSE